MKVNNKSILDTNYNINSKVIYIQWMNKKRENDLLTILKRNDFIEALITSSAINGTCYSRDFCIAMVKLGFNIKVLYTKAISIFV